MITKQSCEWATKFGREYTDGENAVKVVAIIQARMGAARLPGKVLMDIAGKTMLELVVERVKKSKKLDRVVIATTTKPEDDAIVTLCHEREWDYFRGSELDVLDRYYRAALQFNANAIVRICADCPLIDAEVIDKAVGKFLLEKVCYVSNSQKRTYPRGLDVEVFRFKTLQLAWVSDLNPAWREHVTPFIYNHPEMFSIGHVVTGTDYSDNRWTVDTPEDLEFIRRIYEHFGGRNFGWRDVLDYLEYHPELRAINAHIKQKVVV